MRSNRRYRSGTISSTPQAHSVVGQGHLKNCRICAKNGVVKGIAEIELNEHLIRHNISKSFVKCVPDTKDHNVRTCMICRELIHDKILGGLDPHDLKFHMDYHSKDNPGFVTQTFKKRALALLAGIGAAGTAYFLYANPSVISSFTHYVSSFWNGEGIETVIPAPTDKAVKSAMDVSNKIGEAVNEVAKVSKTPKEFISTVVETSKDVADASGVSDGGSILGTIGSAAGNVANSVVGNVMDFSAGVLDKIGIGSDWVYLWTNHVPARSINNGTELFNSQVNSLLNQDPELKNKFWELFNIGAIKGTHIDQINNITNETNLQSYLNGLSKGINLTNVATTLGLGIAGSRAYRKLAGENIIWGAGRASKYLGKKGFDVIWGSGESTEEPTKPTETKPIQSWNNWTKDITPDADYFMLTGVEGKSEHV